MFNFRLLLFVFFVTALLSTACAENKDNKMSIKTVEEHLQRNLKLGENYKQVIEFLDKEKFEHSGYLQKEKKIFGIIRDIKRYPIRKSVQLVFMFNEKGELLKIDIKEAFTGP